MRATRILSNSGWWALLLCATAVAHEGDGDGPELLFGAGVRWTEAANAWPVPRLPGVLEAGSAREDERGSRLTFAEIGLAAPLGESARLKFKVAQHGGGATPEVETAWLAGDVPLGGKPVDWQAGRQLMPFGLENTEEQHMRPFAVAPAILRANLNDGWRADGARADLDLGDGYSVGGGIWINQGFPGAPSDAPSVYSLRAGWVNPLWQVELDAAHVTTDGRALVTTGTAGHTHTLPSCGKVDLYRLCFTGHTRLLALAARFHPVNVSGWLAAEIQTKQDDGVLDSYYGVPDYTGRNTGGWIEAGWRFSGVLSARLRLERLIARHDLDGPNATLVARQAGILASDQALDSAGVVLQWQPANGHLISAEWHDDRFGDTGSVTMLRYELTGSLRLKSIRDRL